MQSYAQALELYNSRPVPPRSRKWKAMEDNARPLRRTSDANKGIHMTSEGVIYYRLHSTKIATLYPPQADGTYRVECSWYDSRTTRQFMRDFGLYYTALFTTDNTRVCIPQVPESFASPHADLTFTADNKLIVSRSHHAEIYTATSTPEDKKRRAALRQELDTIVTLAVFRLESYKREVTVDENYGQPFVTGWRQPPNLLELDTYVRDILYAKQSRGTEIDLSAQEFIEKVMAAGQGVLDILVNRRIYEAVAHVYTYRPDPATRAVKEATQRHIIEEVTPEDFRKSLVNKLLSLFNMKQGNARTPWGQFQKTLPRKFFYK